MAFIRWKHNAGGNRQAYLIHSYRSEDGKPKHKMLAYLGNVGSLTPEHIVQLKEKYADLKINWDKIAAAPRPQTDVSTLSDAELLKKMRHLRHERGWNQYQMTWKLRDNGAGECSAQGGRYLSRRDFGVLEKALEKGEPQEFFLNPEVELAPVLRKVLND